jgi:hypothetical protein
MTATPEELRVFMDADVLFAGSASPSEQGASLALPRLGEIGLLQEDFPILAAALCENCSWLVAFNGRHFLPGHPQITVLRPGDFIQRIRYLLTTLH